MATRPQLRLHEEVLLIALNDERGTLPMTGMPGFALAGAILAELLSQGRIEVEPTRKKLVRVKSAQMLGDQLLDESLLRIREAKRPAPLLSWVTRLTGTRRMHHRIAERLVIRAILRAEERRILRIFRTDAYPTVDSRPEREIRERLSEAVFRDNPRLDERTRLLLAVCVPSHLLGVVFSRKELKPRRKHLKALTAGDPIAQAIEKAVEQAYAVHVAMMG